MSQHMTKPTIRPADVQADLSLRWLHIFLLCTGSYFICTLLTLNIQTITPCHLILGDRVLIRACSTSCRLGNSACSIFSVSVLSFAFSHPPLFLSFLSFTSSPICFLSFCRRWARLLRAMRASVAQLDAYPTGEVTGLIFDWSWNIFYSHSFPSTDSRRAVVSSWRKNVHKYWLTT